LIIGVFDPNTIGLYIQLQNVEDSKEATQEVTTALSYQQGMQHNDGFSFVVRKDIQKRRCYGECNTMTASFV